MEKCTNSGGAKRRGSTETRLEELHSLSIMIVVRFSRLHILIFTCVNSLFNKPSSDESEHRTRHVSLALQ